MGLYTTGEVPFKEVYLHGLILDEHGQKMSKSKGNVINPMELVGQYGSDALRMGIISGQTPGNNQPLAYSKIVGARNFCNKLWNIARYIEDLTGDSPADGKPEAKSAADHWVLSKLQQSQEDIARGLESYRFSEAYETLYHFVWDDLADWYIEASKAEPNLPLLTFVLEAVLALAHPFAPFVTETIWQTLEWEKDSISTSPRRRRSLPERRSPTRCSSWDSIPSELRKSERRSRDIRAAACRRWQDSSTRTGFAERRATSPLF